VSTPNHVGGPLDAKQALEPSRRPGLRRTDSGDNPASTPLSITTTASPGQTSAGRVDEAPHASLNAPTAMMLTGVSSGLAEEPSAGLRGLRERDHGESRSAKRRTNRLAGVLGL